MRVSDLAKELGIASEAILAKLKSLKLKAKDSKQELNAAVVIVLRSEFAKSKSRGVTPKPSAAAVKTVKKEVKAVKKTIAAAKSVPKKIVKATKAKEIKKVKPVAKKVVKSASAVTKAKTTVKRMPAVAKGKSRPAVKPRVEKKEIAKPKVAPAPVVKKEFTPKKTPPPAAVKTAAVPAEKPAETKPLSDLEIPLPITVKEFAVRLQQKPSVLLKRLVEKGIFAHINQNLGEDVVQKLASDFGFSIKKIKTQEEQLLNEHLVDEDDPKALQHRAPVVTFMGHVDHGKTSLLDQLRKSNITDREHGGITQHIGAYSLNLPRGKITFLDTPGHEAFTAMRARGAHITDLVVLVVAADEGVMPQTQEAIDHARAANVPIVVALNKIDKRNADVDRVKKQLMQHDLTAEDWGGKTIVVGVSAVTGEGIDTLLEMILLEAEILELKANPDRKASGIVVEAHLSKGKGAVATVIVQNGTLREGDIAIIGPTCGKIKAMFDDHERPIKEAGPAMPAEIVGLSGVPEAGELFYATDDEKKARTIVARRQEQLKSQKIQSMQKITLEDLYAQIQQGTIKELGIILKADVQGSLEALKESLAKLSTDEVKLRFIHLGVGDVNASDVILASASNAVIIAFNVGVGPRGQAELEKNPVDIRTYRIIYDAINDIKKALSGLLEPRIKKNFVGRVEIRQVFKLSRSGIVAGCYVVKGKMHRKVTIDIVRNGEVLFTGSLSSLKRFKDDVREVAEGYECGITIEGFTDIQAGDIIEGYELEKIARTL